MATPIILDCDPGHDDAVALLLAAGNDEIDLLAVTTVAGNCPLDLATLNARRVVALAGLDGVPIAAGAAGPLQGELVTAPDIHGETGLDGYELTTGEAPLDSRSAIELMVDTLEGVARAGHARPDRAADQRGAAALRPPRPARADPRDRADGRLDRPRQRHARGRVQHLRRPRGGRDRVRERAPADHDRPQPHPPGAGDHRGARARARAAGRAGAGARGLDGVLRQPLRARARRVRAAGPRPVHGRAADRPDADPQHRRVRGGRDGGALDARRDRGRPQRRAEAPAQRPRGDGARRPALLGPRARRAP